MKYVTYNVTSAKVGELYYYCVHLSKGSNIIFSNIYTISCLNSNANFSIAVNLSELNDDELFNLDLKINFDVYLLKALQNELLSNKNMPYAFNITVEY